MGKPRHLLTTREETFAKTTVPHQEAVGDLVAGPDPVCGVDPEGGQVALLRDLLQVARVAAVVPAHHDHHVQRLLHQLEHRVLPLLQKGQ